MNTSSYHLFSIFGLYRPYAFKNCFIFKCIANACLSKLRNRCLKQCLIEIDIFNSWSSIIKGSEKVSKQCWLWCFGHLFKNNVFFFHRNTSLFLNLSWVSTYKVLNTASCFLFSISWSSSHLRSFITDLMHWNVIFETISLKCYFWNSWVFEKAL